MHINRRALAAIGLGGISVVLIGGSVPAGAVAAADADADADTPSSIVEDYSYPGADQVLQQRGIKLIKGDGHIMLADCGADPDHAPADLILVQSYGFGRPGGPNACFKTTGTSGYLTMEIAQVFTIRGNDTLAVSAKVSIAQSPAVVEVEKVDPREWQPIGAGANRPDATILELRFPAS
jgi:hypothetical protein